MSNEQGFDQAFNDAETDSSTDAVFTITYLEVISFKRLRVFRITPDGEMVVIGGWNKQGKSSVLDGIQCLLNGKASVPAEPIHRGKRSGRIKAKFANKLGDHFTVERTFDSKGGTEMEVRDKDGETPVGGSQKFLETLLGGKNPLAFDPSAFIHKMDTKQQDIICRKVCGVDLDDLNEKRKGLESKRKDKNAEVVKLKLRYQDMPEHDDAPAKELDASEISKQLGELVQKNTEVAQRAEAKAEAQRQLDAATAKLEDLARQLAEAKADQDQRMHAMLALPLAGEPEDIAPIQAQLETLTATNAKVRANAEKEKSRIAWETAEEESKEFTEKMEEVDADKAERLAKATYPVPGMGFDEAGPTLNGFPIKQASDREQIQLGVAIAFSQNPALRIALVRAGSFFDPPALRELAAEMKRRGGQAWVEVVRVDDCDVVLEDGEERKKPEEQPVVSP